MSAPWPLFLAVVASKLAAVAGTAVEVVGGKGRSAGRGGGHQFSSEAGMAQADMARLTSGLCRNHFYYGSKAFSCKQPCNWQGN